MSAKGPDIMEKHHVDKLVHSRMLSNLGKTCEIIDLTYRLKEAHFLSQNPSLTIISQKRAAVDIAQGLITTLKESCKLFSSSGIDYCLAGGLAVAMIARPRATEDVDFIILVEEDGKQAVEDILGKLNSPDKSSGC